MKNKKILIGLFVTVLVLYAAALLLPLSWFSEDKYGHLWSMMLILISNGILCVESQILTSSFEKVPKMIYACAFVSVVALGFSAACMGESLINLSSAQKNFIQCQGTIIVPLLFSIVSVVLAGRSERSKQEVSKS